MVHSKQAKHGLSNDSSAILYFACRLLMVMLGPAQTVSQALYVLLCQMHLQLCPQSAAPMQLLLLTRIFWFWVEKAMQNWCRRCAWLTLKIRYNLLATQLSLPFQAGSALCCVQLQSMSYLLLLTALAVIAVLSRQLV